MDNIKKWGFSMLFTLLLLEVFLRVLGINRTYTESIGQGYQSYFGRQTDNTYNTHHPLDTFITDHGDFKYPYITNEIGVREKPLTAFCDSPFCKVIALGDSYTEGMGAPYDSTWPRFAEQQLRLADPSVHMFDAGMNGGDPFFEYSLFRDKLAQCKPAAVIVAVNSSDIDDFFFYGGMERFHVGGMVVNKKGPWYEFLYHYLYIFRMISVDILQQRQQMFVTDAQYEQTEQQFVREATKIFIDFQKAANGRLLVVIHPQPTECAYAAQKGDMHTCGVMSQLIHSLRQKGIPAIDLYPSLQAIIHEDNWMQYTYEHDKHFNAKGYNLFAQNLMEQLRKQYPDFWQHAIAPL